MLNKLNKRSLLIVFIAFFVLTSTGCHDKVIEQSAMVRPVKVMTVPDGTGERSHAFTGTSQDAMDSDLSFQVGGRIVALQANVGQHVSAGDVIARLDPVDYELQEKRAIAQLEQAKAEFIKAKADVERIRILYSKAVVSKSELDSADASYKTTGALLEAARQQRDIAKRNLDYTVLSAPFDGVISDAPLEVHQVVSAGQTIVSLNAKKELEVVVGLPDSVIADVHRGDTVNVKFDAFPNTIVPGTVTEVGINAGSSTAYPVTIALEHTPDRARSGMSVQATFVIEDAYAKPVIPPVAVVGSPDNSTYVFVVDPSTATIRKKAVTLGPLTQKGLTIASGLAPGEILVIRGVHSVTDGMKVRILPDAT